VDIFYLILIGAGVLGLAVVIIGLLKREPGDKPWKWVLGGAAALITVVGSALMLFRSSRRKDQDREVMEPPDTRRPPEDQIEKIDEESDEITEKSEDLKGKEKDLDKDSEELDAEKKDLDGRASETDKLLEESSNPSSPDKSERKPDPELSDYLRNRRGD